METIMRGGWSPSHSPRATLPWRRDRVPSPRVTSRERPRLPDRTGFPNERTTPAQESATAGAGDGLGAGAEPRLQSDPEAAGSLESWDRSVSSDVVSSDSSSAGGSYSALM